jgi:tetratricopeptide (TPR) repeat protein
MKLEFAQNPAYASFEHHLRDLHGLIAAGEGDSDVADALRDSMSAEYRSLSASEEDRLNGLSEDLYSLTESPAPRMQQTLQDKGLAQNLLRAREQYDWAAVLRALRPLAKHFPPSQIAFQRYQAYAQLGHPEIAYLFLEHAAALDPSDFRMQHLLLDFSLKAGRAREALAKAERLLSDSTTTAPLIIAAAHIRFQSLRNVPVETAIPVVREIAARLGRAMQTRETMKASPPSLVILGYTTLGFCQEKLGDLDRAMEAFDEALQLDPESEALRIARGLVLARHDMDRAALEFAAAATTGSRFFHSYLFLAPYELGRGRWEKALQYADQLRARTQDPAVEAQAQNWRAIALFELGRPWPEVEAIFRESELLDRLNPRISENFRLCRDAHLSSAAQRPVVAWSRPGPGDFPDPPAIYWDLALAA